MARPSKNSLPQNENAPPAPSTSAPPPRPSLVRARSSSAPPPRRVFGEATNQENPEDPDKRRSKRVRSRLAAQDHPPPPPPPRPPIRLDKNRTAAVRPAFPLSFSIWLTCRRSYRDWQLSPPSPPQLQTPPSPSVSPLPPPPSPSPSLILVSQDEDAPSPSPNRAPPFSSLFPPPTTLLLPRRFAPSHAKDTP